MIIEGFKVMSHPLKWGVLRRWWVGGKTIQNQDATASLVSWLESFSQKEIKTPFIEEKDFHRIYTAFKAGVDFNAKVTYGHEQFPLSEVLFYPNERNGFGMLKHRKAQMFTLFALLDSIFNADREKIASEIWEALVPIAHVRQPKKDFLNFDVFERLMVYDFNPFPRLLEKSQSTSSSESLMFIQHIQNRLEKEQWCDEIIQLRFDEALSQCPLHEQEKWLAMKDSFAKPMLWPKTEKSVLEKTLQAASHPSHFKPRL